MWFLPSICFCPPLWLSAWLAGAATVTAYRLPTMLAPPARPRWRTPLLSLHVSTLKPNPRAGRLKPSGWLRPRLHRVTRD